MAMVPVKYDALFSKNQMENDVKRLAPGVLHGRKTKKIDNGSPWLQSGSNSPSVLTGEAKDFMTPDRLPRDQYEASKTAEGILRNNLDGIELAIDRRIALFFHHAILVHGMSHFEFSVKDAKDQEGTAPTKRVVSESGDSYDIHRQGAHSSTAPTLIARAKDGSTPDGIIFLKGGSSYATHQAVNGLDILVNQCDTYLDGKESDRRLRFEAMKILNRVASAAMDPIAATHEFMDQLIAHSKECSRHFKGSTKEKHKAKRLILRQYKIFTREAKASFSVDDLFGKLLGVVVDPEDPKQAILHWVAFAKRFALIQKSAVIECSIARKIDGLREKLPANGRNILELILLKEFSEKRELKLLERMFAKTAQIFDDTYFETLWSNLQRENSQIKKPTGTWNRVTLLRCYNGFKTKVDNLRRTHRRDIDQLIDSLRADFIELANSELAHRAKLMRTIREDVRGWTQERLASEYGNHAGYSVSISFINRMEQMARADTKTAYKTPLNQRCKVITLAEAVICAKALNVDVGLFMPELS